MTGVDGRGRRALALALAVSFLLHLLLVALLESGYTPPSVTYRVTLQPLSDRFPQPSRSLAPGPPTAAGPPQPLGSPSVAHAGPLFDLPGSGAGPAAGRTELPGILSGAEGPAPPRPPDFTAPRLATPDLDALAIEHVRALAEEREGYARFPLSDFDADTTDAESRRRSRARQIVERAIDAMGGREALLAIRSMQARVWLEATSYCLPGSPAVSVPPYLYPVAVWHYAMQGTFTNEPIEVKVSVNPARPNPDYVFHPPCNLGSFDTSFVSRWSFPRPPGLLDMPEWLELQRAGRLRQRGEAARWHFIEHFLGAGVNVSYVGKEYLAGGHFAGTAGDRLVEVIQLEDERYGQYQEAFFDQRTGLLLATVDGLTPQEQEWYRRAYPRQRPPVWTAAYDRYRPIRGVLTPQRLVRTAYKPLTKRGVVVTTHLRVAYNGDEPDPSAPRVSESD